MNKLVKNLTVGLRPAIKISTRGTKINFLGLGYSQTANIPVTENEIINTLREKLPGTKVVTVDDTSGGCGAMFNVSIEANEFKGLSVMKQHRDSHPKMTITAREINQTLHRQTIVEKIKPAMHITA